MKIPKFFSFVVERGTDAQYKKTLDIFECNNIKRFSGNPDLPKKFIAFLNGFLCEFDSLDDIDEPIALMMSIDFLHKNYGDNNV